MQRMQLVRLRDLAPLTRIYNTRANSCVRRAAETSLHPVVFCPAHSGEKSLLPMLSALARSGAIAEPARGKTGALVLIGPSSRMRRVTMLRAGLPLKMLVSAVTRAASDLSAARCSGLVVHSGHKR